MPIAGYVSIFYGKLLVKNLYRDGDLNPRTSVSVVICQLRPHAWLCALQGLMLYNLCHLMPYAILFIIIAILRLSKKLINQKEIETKLRLRD